VVSLPIIPLEQPPLDPEFPKISPSELIGFVNAAHATDVEKWQSITGWAFCYTGAAIAYKSKLQPVIATSLTEAEFVTAVHAGSKDSKILAIFLEGPWLYTGAAHYSLWRQWRSHHNDKPAQAHYTLLPHQCTVLCNPRLAWTGRHPHEAHPWHSQHGRQFHKSSWMDPALQTHSACHGAPTTALSLTLHHICNINEFQTTHKLTWVRCCCTCILSTGLCTLCILGLLMIELCTLCTSQTHMTYNV